MNRRLFARWCVGGLVAVAVACVTVNIYFPAAEVQRAADEIVQEVRPEAAAPSQEPTSSEPQSRMIRSLRHLALFWVAPAEADVDINISTPAIRNLKQAIKGRFSSLQPFYKKGVIGENNQGYLEIRDTGDLGLKEKSQVKGLVDAENKDRRALYEEIIRANNLDSKVLPEVEKKFANSWRNQAAGRGWWTQQDDGSWKQ
jgi:uncharacterized protein YdbL (DUF1318 family)